MTANPQTTVDDQFLDTGTNAGDWLVGDYYEQTAHMSLDQVAVRVLRDLHDARFEDMLPVTAEFEVTPDTGGSIPVLRVTITGLMDTNDCCPAIHGDPSTIYEAMRTVFGLTNHYNRVYLPRPERTRFIQHITALRHDAVPVIMLVGMMHDALTLESTAHGQW